MIKNFKKILFKKEKAGEDHLRSSSASNPSGCRYIEEGRSDRMSTTLERQLRLALARFDSPSCSCLRSHLRSVPGHPLSPGPFHSLSSSFLSCCRIEMLRMPTLRLWPASVANELPFLTFSSLSPNRSHSLTSSFLSLGPCPKVAGRWPCMKCCSDQLPIAARVNAATRPVSAAELLLTCRASLSVSISSCSIFGLSFLPFLFHFLSFFCFSFSTPEV